ncbi:hypothetical protein WUBG_17088 [Wuchereria bancrofti]|uniref:Uncharacterized protein n=1 Tax=Wuchereria bancrofti TaxID=6293 RepID=J9DR12_WUCBA|nr:hypothetical protein WUBG_17088 [Wuchereria bancrofti]
MALVSSRGSILEPHKRRHVTKIIYIRVPLLICEIAITGSSTIFAYSEMRKKKEVKEDKSR